MSMIQSLSAYVIKPLAGELDRRLASLAVIGTTDTDHMPVLVVPARLGFAERHPEIPRFGAEPEIWD
jgi:hypothetical protein